MHKKLETALVRSRRKTFLKRKLSYTDLRAFGEKFKGRRNALIIYIEFPYADLLDDCEVLPHFENNCERYYPILAEIPDDYYETVIATGLLEHMKEPKRLLKECYRITKPGGKTFISASCTFNVHRGPDDYFHVTQFGMQELCKSQDWSHLDIRGSCQPFKTVAMMMQRIVLQAEMPVVLRALVEYTAVLVPFFDRFIIRQYYDRSFHWDHQIDSMMPSNIQLIATK